MLPEDEALLDFTEKILQNPEGQKERIHEYLIENTLERFFYNLEEAIDVVIRNMNNFNFRMIIKSLISLIKFS